jgi:hypothetical protein
MRRFRSHETENTIVTCTLSLTNTKTETAQPYIYTAVQFKYLILRVRIRLLFCHYFSKLAQCSFVSSRHAAPLFLVLLALGELVTGCSQVNLQLLFLCYSKKLHIDIYIYVCEHKSTRKKDRKILENLEEEEEEEETGCLFRH